jgi:hypothetical protein
MKRLIISAMFIMGFILLYGEGNNAPISQSYSVAQPYIVVSSSDFNEFQMSVNSHIHAGYEPFGHLIIHSTPTKVVYVQAVYRPIK